MGDPESHDIMGFHRLKRAAVEFDAAAFGSQEAGDCFECRGLAGPIGSEQSHHLALLERKRNSLEGVDGIIVNVNISDIKHSRPTLPCPDRLQ